jgi:AraC-like DNA-binding protein
MSHWLEKTSPSVNAVGISRYPKGVINPWRVLTDQEIFIFDRGWASMTVEGQKFDLPSPWYIIIPPGVRHISYCHSEEVDIYWCHFNWIWSESRRENRVIYDMAESVLSKHPLQPDFVPSGIFHGQLDQREVLNIHMDIVRHFRGKRVKERMNSSSYLLRELIELLGPDEEVPRPIGPGGGFMGEVRAALTSLAQEPFRTSPLLQTTLEKFGLSYHHLERCFKKEYGITPNQYITLVRLERARNILRDTRLPIKECARVLGYEDPAYFIRFFRKHIGQSPEKYRTSILAADSR